MYIQIRYYRLKHLNTQFYRHVVQFKHIRCNEKFTNIQRNYDSFNTINIVKF